ncbi:MAG: MFS transporter [Rhodospirillales bacterium CG15_BIG_FIL_POST_REV_8_21_14_020_66_15]|nr:MAG: MFS transporter [Rhodospirillales bacterium CG15_BIG_FIL_POST_REV_8_21_14_020_66_15]
MFRTPGPVLITVIMCLTMVACLIDVFVFATLIKTFEAEWALTKAEQGWISGIYFAGYTATVPVLMAVTDRIDARRVHLSGSLIIALGALAFALFAEGFWTALIFRTLSGIGLAAVYMPGLRVLVDRYSGAQESRAIAFYTASWSLGVAGSFLVTGVIGEALGWQAAVLSGAAAAIVSFLMVALLLAPIVPQQPEQRTRLLDFRPVFRNRAAMAFIFGYAAHTYELLAYRAWLVAFLAFSVTQQPTPAVGWLAEPARIAAFTALAAMIASVIGNEMAIRLGRARWIAAIQVSSGGLACGLGFLAGESYALVAGLAILHSFLIQADSAPLTAGVYAAAEPGRQGQTLAMHNFIGWTGGFLGPVAVGLVLGHFGKESVVGWGFGYAAMGIVGALGAAVVLTLAGRRTDDA